MYGSEKAGMPSRDPMSWVSRILPVDLSQTWTSWLIVSTTCVGPTALLVSGGIQPQLFCSKFRPSRYLLTLTPGGVNTAPRTVREAGRGWAVACVSFGSASKAAFVVTVRL